MVNRRALIATGTSAGAGAVAAWSLWPRDTPTYAKFVADIRAPFTARLPEESPDRPTNWAAHERARLVPVVRFASLAANSHNTQPWRFLASPDGLRIAPDFTRRCPVVDPEDRHLIASLGCAAENLTLSARAVGLEATVTFRSPDRGADAALAPAPALETAAFAAITKRQTTRAPFDATPLSPRHRAVLEEAVATPGVQARLLTSRPELENLKSFVIDANTAQMNDTAFIEELVAWIRFNQSHAIETRDGLYSGCTGNPALPAWLGRRLVPFFLTPSAVNPKYENQLDGCAGAVVLYAEKDEPAGWFAVGRCAQRFQLEAAAHDIHTSYINQPVETASVRDGFARWLGDGLRPALVLRFGYGTDMPYSLRRPLADVLRAA